ncbi:hypothetical protein ES703_64341 [subsurface metagenome]
MKIIAIFLLSLLTSPLCAEIVRLGAGGEEFCYISPDAEYSIAEDSILPGQGLFSYFSGSDKPLYPEITYPGVVERGNILSGLIFLAAAVDRTAAKLWDAEGNILVEAGAFRIARRRDFNVWSLLLGIPSVLKGGRYTLAVEGREKERHFFHLGAVEVVEKKFGFEQIALNLQLSDLLSKPHIQKEHDFKKLREILQSFNPGSVYHTGSFITPVDSSRITSNFADRRKYQPTHGSGYLSVHNGIDLAAPEGAPVWACGSGRVVMSVYRIMSGNTVVVEHLPGVFSLYYHLSDLWVKAGDMVKQGQILGSVGMTGLATGPHLHWELRVSGVAVDPQVPVRAPLLDKSYIFSILKTIEMHERR